MSLRTKTIIMTIIVAAAAFILGPLIWQPAPSENGPGALLPLFIVISALEAIALGLGVSFLLFGWSWIRTVARDSQTTARVLCVSIAWSLVSWWPHDNMHISNEEGNWARLLLIEYLFHVTLIAAALGMAWAFNGRGLKREQDYLARRGFAVLHPDFRNHAFSDKDEETEMRFRMGYVEDAINAILAVRAAKLPAKDVTFHVYQGEPHEFAIIELWP